MAQRGDFQGCADVRMLCSARARRRRVNFVFRAKVRGAQGPALHFDKTASHRDATRRFSLHPSAVGHSLFDIRRLYWQTASRSSAAWGDQIR